MIRVALNIAWNRSNGDPIYQQALDALAQLEAERGT